MSDSIRFENYELLRNPDGSPLELGRGAMGVTYKARDTDLHCDVALKVINPGILGSPEVRDRFLREARAAARLRHPNIATVFRLGVTPDGTHYYAMEFCDGQTLQQALAAWGALPAANAVHLAWQVSKALRLAEEHRLIHRDLKPANLIVIETPDEGLVVKVIDFGLAKSFADGHQTFSTSGGGFAGTAHFASPEQIDERDLDIRSDIYSLGVCLWFMLTGQPPFEGSAARVMSLTLSAELPLAKLAGQPAPVLVLLRRMLAKNRDDRPTAAALRAEMERCMQAIEALAAAPETPTIAGEKERLGQAIEAPSEEEKPTIKAPSGGTEAERLAARFQLGERLGRDALGRVFRATDRENGGTAVTYRVIEPALTVVPATRRELDAQLTAARAHPHPNLVNVLASAVTGQGHIVVTEKIDGFTLLELLKHRGALPPHEALILLAPLASAADHATTHGLRGLSLGKAQAWVHFCGETSAENRRCALAEPVSTWPLYDLKVEALSLGGSGGGDDDALQSMATLAISGQGFGLAHRTAPSALAHLASELLGGSSGAFTPIARLSEDANTILRRACTEPAAFPTATAFLTALRPAFGKAPTPASATPRPAASAPVPATAFPSSSPPPPRGLLVRIALLALVLAGAGFGYYFGISQPRQRDQQKREAQVEEAKARLEEQQRLLAAERERLRQEAEKTKAEAARLAASTAPPPPPLVAVVPVPAATTAEVLQSRAEMFSRELAVPDYLKKKFAPAQGAGSWDWHDVSPVIISPDKLWFAWSRISGDRDSPIALAYLCGSDAKSRPRVLGEPLLKEAKLKPQWEPVGFTSQEIVIVDSCHLHAQNLANNALRTISDDAWHPVFSPSGAEIAALSSYRSGGANLCLYDIATARRRKVTDLRDRTPGDALIWKEDAILFEVTKEGSEHEIESWRVTSDGKNLTRLGDGQLGEQKLGAAMDEPRRPVPPSAIPPTPVNAASALASLKKPDMPAPNLSKERLREFCQQLQRDEQSHDLNRILANYATKVDYLDQGVVGQDEILKDKRNYFERWPRTTYRLKDDITILSTNANRANVRFQIEFSAEKSSGEKISGIAEETIEVMQLEGLRVVSEKSRVLTRDKTLAVTALTIPPEPQSPVPAKIPYVGTWLWTRPGREISLKTTLTLNPDGKSGIETTEVTSVAPRGSWFNYPDSYGRITERYTRTSVRVDVIGISSGVLQMRKRAWKIEDWRPKSLPHQLILRENPNPYGSAGEIYGYTVNGKVLTVKKTGSTFQKIGD